MATNPNVSEAPASLYILLLQAFVSQHQATSSILKPTDGCQNPSHRSLALASSHALASDPSPLQDFCVADMDSKVRVNGFVCKDPTVVKAEDFFSTGLDKAGDTGKKLGSNVTAVNVNKIVGLNTLGISMVRIDYAPKGLNAPHTHPRATEILTVIEGQLFVGFVTSNSDNGNRLHQDAEEG
ncbi:germin-like protein [Musa troglodytarum]|uniref:Germin-like protein n=1 Tax=Musa troglodytarum TaxID=320322 RepID=A0A9E7K0R3_9LILI|nr:germin-like protein [Musa troglodytarum]